MCIRDRLSVCLIWRAYDGPSTCLRFINCAGFTEHDDVFGTWPRIYAMITLGLVVDGDLDGTPGVNRTRDTRFRKPLLYPLSYRGTLTILSLELVDWQL